VVPAACLCGRPPPCPRRYRQGLALARHGSAASGRARLAVDAAVSGSRQRSSGGGAPPRRRGRALHPPAQAGGAMTPFGLKMRELRAAKGVSQKEMADALGVSAAYLSALEHGKRGVPNWALVQKIVGYFNVIWDEAEE